VLTPVSNVSSAFKCLELIHRPRAVSQGAQIPHTLLEKFFNKVVHLIIGAWDFNFCIELRGLFMNYS